MQPPGGISFQLIELGIVVLGLALIARLASRLHISPIPLYLAAGLAFGNGGLVPLRFTEDFIHLGAEIGVILLLFALGLDHSVGALAAGLRSGVPAAIADVILNFPPGFAAGLILGWTPLEAVLLGGITYISSSGVIAMLLSNLERITGPESSLVVSILVLEDLVMALFLPLAAVLLVGRGFSAAVYSVAVALAAVLGILFLSLRHGRILSRLVTHQSDEVILFTALGLVLLVAGVAQSLHVSAAVGAFLAGLALSGPIAERAQRSLSSLRDLFGAVFFLFFGLQVDPSTLPPVLMAAFLLAVITAATKLLLGWWATHRAGMKEGAAWRVGSALVARGEFSIVIAGLAVGAGLQPQLGVLSTAYVLLLATLGPILARLVDARTGAARVGQPSDEPG
jgi:monovalent cation:H+ antiporter-2, CPA2 family